MKKMSGYKTLLFNLFLIVVAQWSEVRDMVMALFKDNTTVALTVIGVVGILLRLATHSSVASLWITKEEQDGK
jgi:hypothetical protein